MTEPRGHSIKGIQTSHAIQIILKYRQRGTLEYLERQILAPRFIRS